MNVAGGFARLGILPMNIIGFIGLRTALRLITIRSLLAVRPVPRESLPRQSRCVRTTRFSLPNGSYVIVYVSYHADDG